jgi:two-component system chemotaxis response regulator CheY
MADLRCVLVVDDPVAVCRVVEALVRQCGFDQIEAVQDGRAAINRMRASAFEIVICDWEMEPMNGLEVLRYVRGDPATRAIRFILMSAKKEPRWVSEVLNEAADCLLVKPFDAATLRTRLAQIDRAPENV